MKLSKYWKAAAGALAAALSALVTASLDDVVTTSEWYGILAAAALGSGIVYAAPANKA